MTPHLGAVSAAPVQLPLGLRFPTAVPSYLLEEPGSTAAEEAGTNGSVETGSEGTSDPHAVLEFQQAHGGGPGDARVPVEETYFEKDGWFWDGHHWFRGVDRYEAGRVVQARMPNGSLYMQLAGAAQPQTGWDAGASAVGSPDGNALELLVGYSSD